MNSKRYEFLLCAESPVAHHQENFGNTAIAMRRKVRQSDGTFASVPTLTADTMRHGLREAAALSFLDAAGLLGAESLSRAALRLLYSGGMVTGRGDAGQISLDRYREMVELCPTLGLLGGCCDSRVIPGRLFVEDAQLVCKETQAFMPQWILEQVTVLDTCRSHVEEQQRVRMDPLLDPAKRKLLTQGEQIAITNQLTAGEVAHESNDAIAREDAKSTMLPRSFECIVQGSLFYWAVTCNCLSELDLDTLHVMLAAFLYRPVVGGKRATGHGKLRVVAARDVRILRPSETSDVVDTQALGKRSGELFRTHVGARKEQIKRWLSEVDA